MAVLRFFRGMDSTSFIVHRSLQEGIGELAIAFEQLKVKLYQEGLFDEAHKKPLPRCPEKIALITSGSGAAVHDMIRILRKRYPVCKVFVLPVRVQGGEAPPEIAGAIRYANRWKIADLIITGRGGGSMEDLWAFNDERVARAIYASEIPVISAVGHEPDVTIADFVADARASTPSNAAELVVPDQMDLRSRIQADQARLQTDGAAAALAPRAAAKAVCQSCAPPADDFNSGSAHAFGLYSSTFDGCGTQFHCCAPAAVCSTQCSAGCTEPAEGTEPWLCCCKGF